MPKMVAVMDGLEEVAGALRQEGIRVVDVADTGISISAIIYSARVRPAGAEEKARKVSPGGGGGVDDMVLMLNADELTVAEIVARVRSVW